MGGDCFRQWRDEFEARIVGIRCSCLRRRRRWYFNTVGTTCDAKGGKCGRVESSDVCLAFRGDASVGDRPCGAQAIQRDRYLQLRSSPWGRDRKELEGWMRPWETVHVDDGGRVFHHPPCHRIQGSSTPGPDRSSPKDSRPCTFWDLRIHPIYHGRA